MRKFKITYTKAIIVELANEVIDTVDDEWRDSLYNLHTPEEIAIMVGLNLDRGCRLSMLDGWADQPDSNAEILRDDILETECEEIK